MARAAGVTKASPAAGAVPAREDPQRILYLEVPVIVRLAERTMPLSEIVSLSTGAIIEFEKPADSELDLMINNKCIGRGQAVKVGENFGLRVTAVGSIRDRVRALGPR
jgi:flagellar motor switch protein FliN/FliY